jgi:peroxiredoxin
VAQEWYPKFQEMGVEWATISVDDPEGLRRMRDRLGLTFPVLIDPDGAVARSFGCMWSTEGEFNEPAVFLMNKDGVLIYQCILSTANGLAPPADVMEHLQYRIETGRLEPRRARTG